MSKTVGIIPANSSMANASWNVVGHTYTPKLHTENVMIWHAVIPDGTFVPPHIHPTQDEWILVTEGKLQVECGDALHHAGAGDTVRMPMGVAHGIFNRSGGTATAMFGVAPSRRLYALFTALDGVTDPQELVRISALHEVDFLPMPEGASGEKPGVPRGQAAGAMAAGITPMASGIDNVSWNILGQTYVPKQLSDNSFSWHATLPPGTFVPPHIHPTQDEFLYILEGRFDIVLDGKELVAVAGDTVRLPMGIAHGIYNKSDRTAKCLFWVAPARRLHDLFWALHNLGPTPNPADVVAISAQHEVDFLPPPEEN